MSAAVARGEALVREGAGKPDRWRDISGSARASLPATVAVKVLREAHASRPRDAVVQARLARVETLLGEVTSASRLVEQALARRPDLKAALIAHAKLAAREGRVDLARKRYEAALKRHPGSPELLRSLAACSIDLGDRAAAVSALQEIRDGEAASPADHYLLAELQASLEGRWINVAESRALRDRFPEDSQVVQAYLARVQWAGDIVALDDSAWRVTGNADTPSQPSALGQAEAFEAQREFDKAASGYLALFADNWTNLRAVANAARCLGLAGRHDEAQRLLLRVGNGERYDLILQSQATVAGLAGDAPLALRLHIAAVRLCSSLDNAALLCRFLLDAGRLDTALRVRQAIERAFGATQSGCLALAALAAKAKDAPDALRWLERAWRTTSHPRQLLQSFSDALWAVGDSEAARAAMLALVTDRPRLFERPSVCVDAEMAALREELVRCRRDLDACDDYGSYLEIAKRLKRFAGTPYLLKTDAVPDRETGRFLRSLTRLEARGALREAADLVDDEIERAIANTAVPARLGNLLYRAARVNEKLGRHGKCLALLERAAWMDKGDPLLVSAYARAMRAHQERVRLPSDQATVVMIHTWAGNARRARILAREIHARTEHRVFALQGDPSLEIVRLDRQDYGYDLFVPGDDGYMSVTRKLTLAYRYFYSCTNAAGLFKIDDDHLIWDFSQFENLLRYVSSSGDDYVGRVTRYANGVYHHKRTQDRRAVARVAEHAPVAYCHGGCGYYLSRAALKEIFHLSLTYFSSRNAEKIYADVYFAELLASRGIQPKHLDVVARGGLIEEIFEPLMLL